MNSVYVITTHHETPYGAVDAWKEDGVCAIGWSDLGELSKSKEKIPNDAQLFLEIEEGDFIVAYATNNRIALVGDVVSAYFRDITNKVGREDKGGFGYPNQFKVNWYDYPTDFSRKDLPDDLYKQMGLRGKTVIKLDLGKRNFEQVKQIILSNAISGSLTEKGNEDLVKAGLIKNLKKEVSSIENGLIITERESPDDKKNRPDFLAKDKDGNEVIIECKGIADAGDADQIIRYRRNYGKKVRIFLIAFEITQSCKKALKNESVEYFECDLHFKRLK